MVFSISQNNVDMRLSLLNEQIAVDQFIKMEEKDLASDELKQSI